MEQALAHSANLCLFSKNICHQFRSVRASSRTKLSKLQKCRRLATEEDEFLSSVISRGNQSVKMETYTTLFLPKLRSWIECDFNRTSTARKANWMAWRTSKEKKRKRIQVIKHRGNRLSLNNWRSPSRETEPEIFNVIETLSNDQQIQNLVETKFVEIFGRAKHILSS